MNTVKSTYAKNGQLNVKETDSKESDSKNTELLKRHEIEGTPFTVIEVVEEGRFFGVMGGFRLTEESDNLEKVSKELVGFSWNRVIQVLLLLSEQGLLDKSINELENLEKI